MEYVVETRKGEVLVKVQPCNDIQKADVQPEDHPRKEELVGLVHEQFAPCQPEGKSSLWSCVRKITRDDYDHRPKDGKEYGFATKKEAGGRGVSTMWDFGYVAHKDKVPRMANTSGFLKMSFTK